MTEARRILGGMDLSGRFLPLGGAPLAHCLYLIGQAWLKLKAGDDAGALPDLEAAERLASPSAVRSIFAQISSGELAAPEPGPGGMDAWYEVCRRAGAGELELIWVPGRPPSPPPPPRPPAVESEADFQDRLHQFRLDAEAAMKAEIEAARKNA